jgi:hypothetical protein
VLVSNSLSKGPLKNASNSQRKPRWSQIATTFPGSFLIFAMTKSDDFVKSHQIWFRWLSKSFDIQGAVIFQVRDNTDGMSSA